MINSPIFFHELSQFPYPFLGITIEKSAINDPVLARKALIQCFNTSGQRKVKELQNTFQQQQFESIYELKGEWLPNRSSDNPESLRRISEIGRYLYAYQVTKPIFSESIRLSSYRVCTFAFDHMSTFYVALHRATFCYSSF